MSVESLLNTFLTYEKHIRTQVENNKAAPWMIRAAVSSAASKDDIEGIIELIQKLGSDKQVSITINNQTYNNEKLTESILLAVKWFQLNFKDDEKYQGLFDSQNLNSLEQSCNQTIEVKPNVVEHNSDTNTENQWVSLEDLYKVVSFPFSYLSEQTKKDSSQQHSNTNTSDYESNNPLLRIFLNNEDDKQNNKTDPTKPK